MQSTRARLLAAGLGALVILVALVLLLWQRHGGGQMAAALPPLQAAALQPVLSSAEVLRAGGASLLLRTAAGQSEVTLPPGRPLVTLRAAPAREIRRGDFVSVGAAANLINSFAIKQVVVIPAAEAAPAGDRREPPRSRDGFTGFEGVQNDKIGPAVYGAVQRADAGVLSLDGATGPLTLRLPPDAQVLWLRRADAGQIRDGDRLIFLGGADAASATAILARPSQ